MVLVDIPCQTLGRDSCKEHRSFGPVRSGRRVPNPPADRSVCESSAARILIKRPPTPFQGILIQGGSGSRRWDDGSSLHSLLQEVYCLRSDDSRRRWYGSRARLGQNRGSNI